MDNLLSVLAISKKLNLPESTTRYYCRQYEEFLPSTGDGRRKRYRQECLEIIQVIAEMAKGNHSTTNIANRLKQRFPINITVDGDSQQQSLTNYQQGELPIILKELMEAHKQIISQVLTKDQALIEKDKLIANQREEIDRLKSELSSYKKRTWLQKILTWYRK